MTESKITKHRHSYKMKGGYFVCKVDGCDHQKPEPWTPEIKKFVIVNTPMQNEQVSQPQD